MMKISEYRDERNHIIHRHIECVDSDIGDFAIADVDTVTGETVEGPVYFDWVEAEKIEAFLRQERLNADARDAEYDSQED